MNTYLIARGEYWGTPGDVWTAEYESDEVCLATLASRTPEARDELLEMSKEWLLNMWDESNGDGGPIWIVKNATTGEVLVSADL